MTTNTWGVKLLIFLITAFIPASVILLLDSPAALSQMSQWLFQLGHNPTGISAPVTLKLWKARDFIAMNRQFDALQTDLPKDLIKAIAWTESHWTQVDENGDPFTTVNLHRDEKGRIYRSVDWGLMQVNGRMESLDTDEWDLERIKLDPEYNLRAGVAILKNKLRYVRSLKHRDNWRSIENRYRLKGYSTLEIALKAYNGFQPSWSYVRRVQINLHAKPWERAMQRQLQQASVRSWGPFQFLRTDVPAPIAVDPSELAITDDPLDPGQPLPQLTLGPQGSEE